jgi:hypothetical protein
MVEVWHGKAYDEHHQLLLLGESAYSWLEDGDVVHPSTRHAVELVEEIIANFPTNPFMTKLTRALAGTEWPTKEQIEATWSAAAFANYIDGTVGLGPRLRPTAEMWERAKLAFPQLLNGLKPKNIVVLGKIMWDLMPEADVWLTDDVQGYRLGDGTFAVCWAINHPSAGLSWRRLSQLMAFAVTRNLTE